MALQGVRGRRYDYSESSQPAEHAQQPAPTSKPNESVVSIQADGTLRYGPKPEDEPGKDHPVSDNVQSAPKPDSEEGTPDTSAKKPGMIDRLMSVSGTQDSPTETRLTKAQRICFIVWAIIGCCVLTGVLIYLMQILAIPVSITIWTLVFVFCLRGIVNELEEHHINRALGTTISYIIMFLVLGIIAFLMFSPVFGLNNQFADIISNIPMYTEAIRSWTDGLYQNYGHWLDNDTIRNFMTTAEKSITDWSSSLATGAANAVMGFGTTVANSVMAIGFALVIAFWILLELPAIGAETRRVISPKFADSAEFLHITFTRIMGGYLKGTLLQCFIIGLGCGVLFAIVRIPNAPALGVITGIMNIIPIIGPWIGGAFAAISAIFVSPLTAFIALVGTIIIQQFVYTFVSPKIMQSSVDVHPALTLMAMMVGSAVGGAMSGILGSLVGMLFSIPAVAVIRSCFIFYFEKRTGRKIVSDDGVLFKGHTTDSEYVNPLLDATSGMGKKELKKLKSDRETRARAKKIRSKKHAEKDAEKERKKERKESEKV